MMRKGKREQQKTKNQFATSWMPVKQRKKIAFMYMEMASPQASNRVKIDQLKI